MTLLCNCNGKIVVPDCPLHAPQSNANHAPLAWALRFELPGLPDTPNARQHHMAKARHVAKWRQKVFAACWHKRPDEPLIKARITLTRCSSVCPDYDNLVASFKACLDGLKQAKVIVDDKMMVIGVPTYLWEQSPKGLGKVKIQVEGK